MTWEVEMAILLDFSQTVLSACYAFENELSVNNPDKEGARSIIRHVVLSQIKYWFNKYRYRYGNLIICCDGKHYWRKDRFREYKATRKKARAQSSMDWHLVFDVIDETIAELKENFPYKVIQYDKAECDDIIAVLTKYFQKNELDTDNGLFPTPQKCIIISSDKDFVQLQKYNNVSQVSPHSKAFVKTDDVQAFLKEKIIRGDKGDGIPSVLNPNDIYVSEGRKTVPMTKKRFEALMEQTCDTCADPVVKARWMENRELIDFEYIPEEVEKVILEEYAVPIRGNKAKVYNYLVKHQCFQLLNEVDKF